MPRQLQCPCASMSKPLHPCQLSCCKAYRAWCTWHRPLGSLVNDGFFGHVHHSPLICAAGGVLVPLLLSGARKPVPHQLLGQSPLCSRLPWTVYCGTLHMAYPRDWALLWESGMLADQTGLGSRCCSPADNEVLIRKFSRGSHRAVLQT